MSSEIGRGGAYFTNDLWTGGGGGGGYITGVLISPLHLVWVPDPQQEERVWYTSHHGLVLHAPQVPWGVKTTCKLC